MGSTLGDVLGMDIPAAWQQKSGNNPVTMAKLTSVATGVLKTAFVPGTTDDAVTKLFYDLSYTNHKLINNSVQT